MLHFSFFSYFSKKNWPKLQIHWCISQFHVMMKWCFHVLSLSPLLSSGCHASKEEMYLYSALSHFTCSWCQKMQICEMWCITNKKKYDSFQASKSGSIFLQNLVYSFSQPLLPLILHFSWQCQGILTVHHHHYFLQQLRLTFNQEDSARCEYHPKYSLPAC